MNIDQVHLWYNPFRKNNKKTKYFKKIPNLVKQTRILIVFTFEIGKY